MNWWRGIIIGTIWAVCMGSSIWAISVPERFVELIERGSLEELNGYAQDHPDEIAQITDADGKTLVHRALDIEDTVRRCDVLDTLILNGCSVRATDMGGKTPLHYAVQRDDAASTVVLTFHGTESDWFIRDASRCRPYDYAQASLTELWDEVLDQLAPFDPGDEPLLDALASDINTDGEEENAWDQESSIEFSDDEQGILPNDEENPVAWGWEMVASDDEGHDSPVPTRNQLSVQVREACDRLYNKVFG